VVVMELASKIDPLLNHQIELELLFNKNQTVHRIRKEFVECKSFDYCGFIQSKDIDLSFGIDLLVQMVLHRRTTLPVLVSILRHHFDSTQQTANEVLKAVYADLVDWNSDTRQLIIVHNISQDVQDDLDRFQYPLPMVVEPRPVNNNRDTGYLTGTGSIILRKNHHDDDVCLDHINRVNRVPFVINADTAHMIKNQWRNLDKPKPGETKTDFDKRVKAFEKYDRTAKEVIDLLLSQGDRIYLTHKYDKRGRTYCQGYHVNYQGAEWNKAVIELANREVVPL
jgi:hypothetical protein